MYVTKTIFTIQYKGGIGKPALVEGIDVLASDMTEAIQIVKDAYNYPRITLVQDKGQAVLTKGSD